MTTRFRVLDDRGRLRATVSEPEIGAAIIAGVGWDGWTIRWNRKLVWVEGMEEFPANESFDRVADRVYDQLGRRAK